VGNCATGLGNSIAGHTPPSVLARTGSLCKHLTPAQQQQAEQQAIKWFKANG
jgi:hypothetical protein